MSRPEDIPEDVWEAADAALIAGAVDPSDDGDTTAVARAILAEREQQRERDAKIALDPEATYGGQGADWLAGQMYARQMIAAAIRKGSHQ